MGEPITTTTVVMFLRDPDDPARVVPCDLRMEVLGERMLLGPNARMPDLGWVFTDPTGHEHRYVKVEGQADLFGRQRVRRPDTLRDVVVDTWWCADCRDEHETRETRCRLCDAPVTPGTQPAPDQAWVRTGESCVVVVPDAPAAIWQHQGADPIPVHLWTTISGRRCTVDAHAGVRVDSVEMSSAGTQVACTLTLDGTPTFLAEALPPAAGAAGATR